MHYRGHTSHMSSVEARHANWRSWAVPIGFDPHPALPDRERYARGLPLFMHIGIRFRCQTKPHQEQEQEQEQDQLWSKRRIRLLFGRRPDSVDFAAREGGAAADRRHNAHDLETAHDTMR